MIPEIGHFSLILALMLAMVQMAAYPMAQIAGNASYHAPLARMAALCQCFCITIAFFALISCYADSDFSVLNVAANSHTDKPLFYKITASWGNHEGSMLLWVWILSLYGFALACASFQEKNSLLSTALSVQGFVSAGFLLFLLLTSNPFQRLDPAPLNGQDLNPLLQDVGLALHPPVLYLGYVGFSIIYSLAVAALLLNRLDRDWAVFARPWVLLTWGWLTVGIGLGSWWAYRELGWGGWWFWDPVENAALLPWLAGTALLHSLIVLEKQGGLKRWVLLLSILTFSLSLLGTFLVRSGVITSVHSFASDPARGVFILAYMVVVCGGAFALYGFKTFTIEKGKGFAPVSRVGGIVFNNLFLLAACGTVALGTLYPMALEILFSRRVSVGAPFFNLTVVPLMAVLLVVIALVPFLSWKGRVPQWWHGLRTSLTLVLGVALACLLWGNPPGLIAVIAVALASWAMFGTLAYFQKTLTLQVQRGPLLKRLRSLPLRTYAMTVSHLGFGLLALGIALSSYWKIESQFSLPYEGSAGDSFFMVRSTGLETSEGPNYRALKSELHVLKNGQETILRPETRHYPVRQTRTSEVDYRSTPLADLYAVTSEPSPDGSLTARIYYLPGMNMIWLGILMMAAGGFLPACARLFKKEAS